VIHLSLETPIRDLRTHLGLSQAELAKRLGVNQSNVSAMERRPPTMRTFAKVLAALDLAPTIAVTRPAPIRKVRAA
jgi:transcriptional regulator with XRE-family HTH domain